MKKLFVILTVAFGMLMVSSCNSCTNSNADVTVTEFVYDVTATAKGEGKFTWEALPHTGDVTLNGELVVNATNDTTAVKLFAAVPNGAPTLAAGLVSDDPAEAAAAAEVQNRLKTTHLEGDYQLDATGYAKFGPFYFVIDEHYPPIDSVAVK